MIGPQVLEYLLLEAENKKKEALRTGRIYFAVGGFILLVFLFIYAAGMMATLNFGPSAALMFLSTDLVVASILVVLVWIATGTMDFLQEFLPPRLKDEIPTLRVVSSVAVGFGVFLLPLFFATIVDVRNDPMFFLTLATSLSLLTFLGGFGLYHSTK